MKRGRSRSVPFISDGFVTETTDSRQRDGTLAIAESGVNNAGLGEIAK